MSRKVVGQMIADAEKYATRAMDAEKLGYFPKAERHALISIAQSLAAIAEMMASVQARGV